MDSSLFVVVVKKITPKITPVNGSCYKLIDSSIQQEIFYLTQNVNHANECECRINMKVEIK